MYLRFISVRQVRGPPITTSPTETTDAVMEHRREAASRSYDVWNSALRRQVQAFCAMHDDITALLFSSHRLFQSLLENPEVYGFEAQDAHKMGGGIWFDYIHPTSKVHDFIASDVADFLEEVYKG